MVWDKDRLICEGKWGGKAKQITSGTDEIAPHPVQAEQRLSSLQAMATLKAKTTHSSSSSNSICDNEHDII